MGSIYINSLAHTFRTNANINKYYTNAFIQNNANMLEVPITDSKEPSYRKVKVVEIHI